MATFTLDMQTTTMAPRGTAMRGGKDISKRGLTALLILCRWQCEKP